MFRNLTSRMRFEAKVLIPVIGILIMLMAATMWIVNLHFTNRVHHEATQRLRTADRVLTNSRQTRKALKVSQYQTVANTPGVIALTTESVDAATVRAPLEQLARELDVAAILLTTDRDQYLVAHPRMSGFDLEGFGAACEGSLRAAIENDSSVDTVLVDERLLEVISVPVTVRGEFVAGMLTFGSEIGLAAARELKAITESEIVLFGNDRVIAATLALSDAEPEFLDRFRLPSRSRGDAPRMPGSMPKVEIAGERFQGLLGSLPSQAADQSLGYVLLSSYEEPLRELRKTQRLLLALGSLGILLSSVSVSLLVRKITQPLRQLRDGAEAVGLGNLDYVVPITSKDECGELAATFNRMTENLKSSRADLEETVATLKTTRAQLIQSEKLSAIGEFVAGITHELNNPLTAVVGFAELLRRIDADPKHGIYVDNIVIAANRCHKIVQSLLSFARQHPPERTLIDINEIIDTTLSFVRYELRTGNIEVRDQLDRGLPKVWGDPHQLQQVFLNLLNNARQAIEDHRPSGWIRIESRRAGPSVRIQIEDSGPGVPRQHLAEIFNPFFTTKEVGKGTGLGLSLSYGIIQEHGGTITAESPPGSGAAFTIDLPVADASSSGPGAGLSSAADARLEGAGKRVLVIDDEEPVGLLLREILEEAGFEVQTATSGQTALDLAACSHFDVILCDWKMPGLSGQQVYERLRAQDPAAADRLIFTTGDVVRESTARFFQEQNKVCLTKPFSLVDLRDVMRTAAQQGPRESRR